MACGGCGHARQQFVYAARTYNIRGAVQAIRTGVAINVDKARGTYDERKYTSDGAAVKATPLDIPYKRPDPVRSG